MTLAQPSLLISLLKSIAGGTAETFDPRSQLRLAPMKTNGSRLTTPLVRDNGKLRPASWDEALTRAASGFREARSAHGGQGFGLFSCSKATNEMNFMAQKFARVVMGSNNIDSCNRT
jgi:formate dehydrogenase (hydrogenase)